MKLKNDEIVVNYIWMIISIILLSYSIKYLIEYDYYYFELLIVSRSTLKTGMHKIPNPSIPECIAWADAMVIMQGGVPSREKLGLVVVILISITTLFLLVSLNETEKKLEC